jgi:hypothetical protein
MRRPIIQEEPMQDIAMQDPNAAEPELEEEHPLPVGALIFTLSYLVLLTALWLEVYLQMLNSGGLPQ